MIFKETANKIFILTLISLFLVSCASVDQVSKAVIGSSGFQEIQLASNTLNNNNAVYSDGTKLYVADFFDDRVLIYNHIPTSNDASADVVVGQPNMFCGDRSGLGPNTLKGPSGVCSDGKRLYIADTLNDRVLIYNHIPTSNDARADVVVGQADMRSDSNVPGIDGSMQVGANTLDEPEGVYSDGVRLYVADTGDGRILIYNHIPTSNGASADVVVGPENMSGRATTLSRPQYVCSDGTRLYIADTDNNRVLIYNDIPTSNGASPDVVVGQSDITGDDTNSQAAANQGGDVAANTLNDPVAVYSDGKKLYIADAENSRILIYNDIPTSNDASADVVVGQTGMSESKVNQGRGNCVAAGNTLDYPEGVYSDGKKLYVSDSFNSRVLIYNSIPATNNGNADVIVGQPNMSGEVAYQMGCAGADTLLRPSAVYGHGSKLCVADTLNQRVLIYDSIPTSNNTQADVVVGQENMSDRNGNEGGDTTANTLAVPAGVCDDGKRLFVADQYNNRVLIYASIPGLNNASAAVVVGQVNMSGRDGNSAGAVADNTLYGPSGTYSDGGRLYIADTNNNRVLIYNRIPVANGASADVVVGQVDMSGSDPNQGKITGANTLHNPMDVYSDGTRLFVVDQYNNRVLIYEHIPTSNNASADVVLGQKDMSGNAPNQGSGVTADTLAYPSGVFSDGTRLYITDAINNRVLIYNHIPTANNVRADVVLGQINMSGDGRNQGRRAAAAANTLAIPLGVYSDGTRLYIADYFNNRVLIWNHIPTTNNANADEVLGQPAMNQSSFNEGGGFFKF